MVQARVFDRKLVVEMLQDMADWDNQEVCNWTRSVAATTFAQAFDPRAENLRAVEVYRSAAGWVGVGPDKRTCFYPDQQHAIRAVARAVRAFLDVKQVPKRPPEFPLV